MAQPTKISLRQYVENPYKGSAFLASRQNIKRSLNSTFLKLLQHNRRQFFTIPYTFQTGEILYHVRVPSEGNKDNKIIYDVFVLVAPGDGRSRISGRNIKLFSNCPSFVYTYAYVYNKMDLLIDPFKGKIPSRALTDAPVIRNPVESMGFEKSTYCAIRFLLESGATNDIYVKKYGRPGTETTYSENYSRITTFDRIMRMHKASRELKVKHPKKPVTQERRIENNKIISDGGKNMRETTSNLRKGKKIRISRTRTRNIKRRFT